MDNPFFSFSISTNKLGKNNLKNNDNQFIYILKYFYYYNIIFS